MNQNSLMESLKSGLGLIVIVVAFAISFLVFHYVFGDPANFEGGIIENNPLKGNYYGVIYKGGFIVPMLMTLLLMVITFTIERVISITRAKGKGNLVVFVKNLKSKLDANRIDEALEMCNTQKGSLANVMRSGLESYTVIKEKEELTKDQKVTTLRKELEEATALELPMLSKNLVILSTIASIATLIGLIGTVLGMIRAFAALATSGAPDAVALASGISEALINTAFGISTSTLAIIAYNYFSTQIDKITYRIDEAGFSLVQTFASQEK